jgi:heme/copper-type cytochrome/quinol oxidase subunit 2
MSVTARKLVGVLFAVAVVGVLIALYISQWATAVPETVTATPTRSAVAVAPSTHIVLQTDAAVGPQESPAHPDWVGYLVQRGHQWVRSTIYQVPAHSLVHVTIYQFDGDSGLRNPFLARVQGTSGSVELVDGKPLNHIEAEEASHTFVIPQLGVFAPLPGVPEEAKNQCEYGPCDPATMAHRTIELTFRTGKKGRYRWQCFVPCAAGTYFGFGGPMQTLGYMDGYIDVV